MNSLNLSARFTLLLTRVALGIFFFYAGITKVLDSTWSAAGYIGAAKTFPNFYQLLLNPAILPIVNFLNAWGLTILGLSLILGLFVRLSSLLGVVLMLLYYFAAGAFPHPNAHALLIDEHIIYITVLLFFASVRAGRYWGLDQFLFRN
ncbi:MAG: DoxX family membrane protein [Candidatus Vogelbacteria bacterium]